MEESGRAPTEKSSISKKQVTAADNDQRALFFHRTAVYGERGAEYRLAGSSHLNSCCWVGTVTGKEADGSPCIYTIEVFKADPSMRGNIWREIRALSTIANKTADSKSENYLPLLKDQGVTQTGLRFALTTFTGRPLSDVLSKQKEPLQASSAQRVTHCLTKALAYIHKADIIHGNISCYAALTGSGLSTDAGNIRLGGFYYSTVKGSTEKVSYPLNIYTARAIHDKQNATVTTDLESFIFLFYHLFVGLPWQKETDVKKVRKQKDTFFEKLADPSWKKIPFPLWQMAKKVKKGKPVDLNILDDALGSETDKKRQTLEWETAATMEEEMNKETNIVPGFFFPPKDDKQKERIEQLADAVGPDR